MSSGLKRTAEDAGLPNMGSGRVSPPPPSSRGGREMQGSGADGGKKHTIDSDEEEEMNNAYNTVADHDKMKEDDIEGQEDDQVLQENKDLEDGVKITPFNLREEQEEGTFTKDGNFVWKKEKEIVDSWLDNVDWVKVKEMSAEETRQKDLKDEEEDEAEAKYDELSTYKQCLKLMKEGETVAKAIKRLSGGKKALPAWRMKKMKQTPEEKANRELMMQLTGWADSILSRSGNMEIYEETYEKIAYKIKQMEPQKAPAPAEIPDDVDDDDALDMFADNLDKTDEKKKPEETKEGQKPAATPAMDLDSQVHWEFKWKTGDDEKVHGPHSSEEMLEWQTSGFFDKGVYVRKVGTTGDFLDGKRIDFDLYT